jgi:hypothetical protein
MQSSLIGKIQKANVYSHEPERLRFTQFTTTFRGEHDSYTISFQDNQWRCTCDFFHAWGLCTHTMAVEKMLSPMLPAEARQSIPTFAGVSS